MTDWYEPNRSSHRQKYGSFRWDLSVWERERARKRFLKWIRGRKKTNEKGRIECKIYVQRTSRTICNQIRLFRFKIGKSRKSWTFWFKCCWNEAIKPTAKQTVRYVRPRDENARHTTDRYIESRGKKKKPPLPPSSHRKIAVCIVYQWLCKMGKEHFVILLHYAKCYMAKW